MIEFLQKGGWFMIPIGICLFLGLAIAIERMVNLRRGRFVDESLLGRLRTLLVDGQFDAALQICRTRNILFHRLLETAIQFRSLEIAELRQLLEDQSRQEAAHLERFLTTLRTIATISPLLGLLGTVAGMIKVFQTLSNTHMSEVGQLSGGISEALITTAAGMLVAIPTIVLHNVFERKVNKTILHVEKILVEFMILMRSPRALHPQDES